MNRVILILATVPGLMCAGIVRAQEFHPHVPPRVVYRPEPQYTPGALDAKISGTVMVSMIVRVDGIPAELKVVQGLGYGLDEKAIECVSQWRFEPGIRRGIPTDTKATIQLTFRLPTPPTQTVAE